MPRVSFGVTCWKDSDAVKYGVLGASVAGGRLICKSGGVGWIVAPGSTEVSRTWYCRNDAVTTSQSTSGCTGWFVPTISQLSNPGYACRTYWESYSSLRYWGNEETDALTARYMVDAFGGGSANGQKTLTQCVRAFRCVTY